MLAALVVIAFSKPPGPSTLLAPPACDRTFVRSCDQHLLCMRTCLLEREKDARAYVACWGWCDGLAETAKAKGCWVDAPEDTCRESTAASPGVKPRGLFDLPGPVTR
jgi:hypothetical protein